MREGTFLWFDNWHPLGPIVQKYSSRIRYDAAIPVYAKVNTIIAEKGWKAGELVKNESPQCASESLKYR